MVAAEKKAQKALSVLISPEAYDAIVAWKEAEGYSTLNSFFEHIGQRAKADAIYVLPAMGSSELLAEQQARLKALARREARAEVMDILFRQGFVSSPHIK